MFVRDRTYKLVRFGAGMDVRPSVLNALVPELFGKVVVPGLLVSLVILALGWMLPSTGDFTLLVSIGNLLSGWSVHLVVWGLLLLPFAWTLIVLARTVYRFGPGSVTREFSLFVVRRTTIPYNKIVHVKMRMSIWDRISGAGNITLHTAENNAPDLTLRFIPSPQKMEKWLIGKMK